MLQPSVLLQSSEAYTGLWREAQLLNPDAGNDWERDPAADIAFAGLLASITDILPGLKRRAQRCWRNRLQGSSTLQGECAVVAMIFP